MLSVNSAISALRGILQRPVSASEKPKPNKEHLAMTAIQFEGECNYMAFRRFLFKAAYPNADNEVLATPSLLIERDGDIRGRGKIHVEASTKQTICDLPGSTARLISVKQVLGVIYNSRDGGSMVFWREPRKIWGHASPRTFAMLLNCKVRITPIIAPPCTKPQV
jgi:hypothetical protein